MGFEHNVYILICSSLYNTRVVLRQLSSAQAMRRGKRAIEVCRPCGVKFYIGTAPSCFILDVVSSRY